VPRRSLYNRGITDSARIIVAFGAEDPEVVRAQLRRNAGGEEPKQAEVDEVHEACKELVAEGFRVEVPNDEHVRITLSTVLEIARHFYVRPWVVVRYPAPVLITSDVPVVGHLSRPVCYIPLDPGTALHILNPEFCGHGGDALMSKPRSDGVFLNQATAVGASLWIFHHPTHSPYLDPGVWPRRTTGTGVGKPPGPSRGRSER
jgi:hypothetical protein